MAGEARPYDERDPFIPGTRAHWRAGRILAKCAVYTSPSVLAYVGMKLAGEPIPAGFAAAEALVAEFGLYWLLNRIWFAQNRGPEILDRMMPENDRHTPS